MEEKTLRIISIVRSIYKKVNQKRLKNKNMSIIASNCNGACISHDLGLRFNSPFVNLWMYPGDYLKMLHNLPVYLKENLEFIENPDCNYPVAKLGDITLFFQHYKSKEEAAAKWEERIKRINYNNLFILFTDRDGCTYEQLLEFDRLPFLSKIVFTHLPYKEIKSSVYIRGFEHENSVGVCTEYKNKYAIKKYYDQFDYVSWFNEKSQ